MPSATGSRLVHTKRRQATGSDHWMTALADLRAKDYTQNRGRANVHLRGADRATAENISA